MPPYALLISLALLGGALLLASTLALALAAGLQRVSVLRLPMAVLAEAVALFPLAAWVWAAIGLWAGQLGWPVVSLMPALDSAEGLDLTSQIARQIWTWAPALWLLALPMTGELLARRLLGGRPLHVQLCLAGLPGVFLLPVVEGAFQLPGAFAGLLPALRSPATSSLILELFPLVALAVLWAGLTAAWPRTVDVTSHLPTARDKIREGALVIGFTPLETWKRHLLPWHVRRGLAMVCSATAWAWMLWISYGCLGCPETAARFQAAYEAALEDPAAPLHVAWPQALCALSLWLAGRIIRPRQD